MSYLQNYYKENPKICNNCGQENGELHLHHIIPKNQGGTNEFNNLICLCYVCHKDYHKKYKDQNNHEDQIKEYLDSPSVFDKEINTSFINFFTDNVISRKDLTEKEKLSVFEFFFKVKKIKEEMKKNNIDEFYYELNLQKKG